MKIPLIIEAADVTPKYGCDQISYSFGKPLNELTERELEVLRAGLHGINQTIKKIEDYLYEGKPL